MRQGIGVAIKHLEFIAGKYLNGGQEDCIYVLTRRRNGRIRKKKLDCVGYIAKHLKTNKWCFYPAKNWCYGSDNLETIYLFIYSLEHKHIKFDQVKGELLEK